MKITEDSIMRCPVRDLSIKVYANFTGLLTWHYQGMNRYPRIGEVVGVNNFPDGSGFFGIVRERDGWYRASVVVETHPAIHIGALKIMSFKGNAISCSLDRIVAVDEYGIPIGNPKTEWDD